MVTPQEKAKYVSWFIETKSGIQAQRNFRRKLGRAPTATPNIRSWHKKLQRLVERFKKREQTDFKFLNETLLRRKIGRDGPIPWPPRSPNITPLDFFLLDYVPSMTYRTKVRGIIDHSTE